MTRKYNPKEIEPKWQERWEKDDLYNIADDAGKTKWYFLTMFPYPSGPLHAGHWFMYSPPDAKARYLRMKGYNVFFPMGFDAFGLPAENAAIKRGLDPKAWTYDNMKQMRNSFRKMGASYTLSHSVATCEPEYYKWTQWLFIQFFKNGLAYHKKAPVDWCPNCNTSLAREQVKGEDRRCDRCHTQVTKKDLDQWLFSITKYADELLDFSQIDWPDRVRVLQTEWIGRSEGAEIDFKVDGSDDVITVFTTRPDTVFGATFAVLAPEHPFVAKLTSPEQKKAVQDYVDQAKRTTEIERLSATREKTGVPIGANAVNPCNGELMPIWVADYVLMGYGTGAIMSVPAHDQRDFEFAKKFNLPIRVVVQPPGDPIGSEEMAESWPHEGVMINSGAIDGIPAGKEEGQSIKAAISLLEEIGSGRSAVTYRLHDWLISRQRYWGAPIPIIHCASCGAQPVPDDQLPVMLPEGVQFLPTGESPLKLSPEFRNAACPKCSGPAERDTDTMDTFVDSSWYWYRYLSPHKSDGWTDGEAAKRWLPVDEYAGGIEHATMHLLYARFFVKALNDMGYVDHREPFKRLFNQGIILGEDGNKMSKSRGNVIDPNSQVDIYGSDCLRAFLMFIGPWEAGGPWSNQGIEGVARFYKKVWNLIVEPAQEFAGEPSPADVKELLRMTHKTIGKVGNDIETFQFNTAVSCLMEFVNYLTKEKNSSLNKTAQWSEALKTLVLLIAPLGPHIAEELWEFLDQPYSVHKQSWPKYEAALAAAEVFTLVVQINGKVRERIEGVSLSLGEEEIKQLALSNPNIAKQLAGKQPRTVIYVPKRLINIVA